MILGALRIHPEVRDAARSGEPIVALETAVLTHGLPRTPMAAPQCCAELLCGTNRSWNATAPANRELLAAMSSVVRANRAVPAAIGMIDGTLVIGLDDDEATRLGADARAVKISARDLGVAHASGASGGTTVAGTLAALAVANRALTPDPRRSAIGRIACFATGGIGGVHRGWSELPDVSADLLALARTPVCVVSAGAKSILDIPATVEALDTLGVPVLGLRTEWFPRFLTAGAPPVRVQRVVEDLDEAVAVCRAHWEEFGAVSGVLLANPPDERWSMSFDDVDRIVNELRRDAFHRSLAPSERTPFLLAGLARQSGGESVEANVAVLLSNARVAAQCAVRMAISRSPRR